jgi:hypothetical protein
VCPVFFCGFLKGKGWLYIVFSLNFTEIPLCYAEKGTGKQSRGRRNLWRSIILRKNGRRLY